MSDIVTDANPVLERFRLDGRVALVTGAGQGIGRAYAHALGEAGAAVAIVDLVTQRAEEVCQELAQKGVNSIAVTADVTRPESVDKMVSTIVKHYGKLTIGVNNAGVGQWISAEDMVEADWDHMLDTNLKGVFLCAQAEGKAMFDANYGKIVNTGSMSGTIVNTPQKQAHYNASKAAVVHLTKSLAVEWAPRGIRVNSISPGFIRTKLGDDLLMTPIGKEMMPRWMALTPQAHMGEVTDLQGLVVYLSSGASDFMTGSDVIIDGGYCCV